MIEITAPPVSKIDALMRWYKNVWEDGNLEFVDAFFVTSADNEHISSEHLVPNFGVDPTEVREWVSILRSFVTDIHVKALHSIEEGNWLSAMLEISCQQRETTKKIIVIQQIMVRFEGGKTAESYPAFDFIRFFEQLGQLPEDTHALLLSGTKLK